MSNFYSPSFFKAIGHPVRQQILEELQKSDELNVAEIVKKLGLSQPTISHHLAILKDAGVIKLRTKGTNSIYSVYSENACECCCGLEKFFKK